MVRLSFNLKFKKDKVRTQESHITAAAIIFNLVTIIMAYSSYVKNCQIEISIQNYRFSRYSGEHVSFKDIISMRVVKDVITWSSPKVKQGFTFYVK